LRSKWAAGKALRAGLGLEGASGPFLCWGRDPSRMSIEMVRDVADLAAGTAAGPDSTQPSGPQPVGCFCTLLAPYVPHHFCAGGRPKSAGVQKWCGMFVARALSRRYRSHGQSIHPLDLGRCDRFSSRLFRAIDQKSDLAPGRMGHIMCQNIRHHAPPIFFKLLRQLTSDTD
jgi:hypothetical protein